VEIKTPISEEKVEETPKQEEEIKKTEKPVKSKIIPNKKKYVIMRGFNPKLSILVSKN
jgi:hypothetical protein